MINVGEKEITQRTARASAVVRLDSSTKELIQNGHGAKGDVLEVARLAGIMAAKRTGDLIPLCHPLPIEAINVDFSWLSDDRLRIEGSVSVSAKTGVEMEALTAVSVTALTVYDMCKSVDRSMSIEKIQLEEKTGGHSGHFCRDDFDGIPCKE